MKRSDDLHVLRETAVSGVGPGALAALGLGHEPTASLRDSVLRTKVADVMIRVPLGIPVNLSVESATWIMLERGMTTAPVVDLQGKLVGSVSMVDIVRERMENAETEESVPCGGQTSGSRGLDPGFSSTRLARSTVGEIMSPITLVVRRSSSLVAAAALMGFEGLEQLPVLTRAGHLVGLLSSVDVLRWLARATGYTEASHLRLRHQEHID